MSDRDEELKELLLNYGEHILVSVYDGDKNHKHRRNSKRARILEKIIIENVTISIERVIVPPSVSEAINNRLSAIEVKSSSDEKTKPQSE